MSGDVFLFELFVRALSHVSATEQIVYPCVGSYDFGILERLSMFFGIV